MTVDVDEAYVLISQPKMKALVKQHFSRAEQPIKTLTTVNKLMLLGSDRKLYVLASISS